jgi:hypothetical protein
MPTSKDKAKGRDQKENIVPMNFRVPESFRRDFKLLAVQNDISMVDLFMKAVEALKDAKKAGK